MTSRLCFVDTETTGLDPRIHQAYEVAWAIDDGPIRTCRLPHTLDHADPFALKVGDYFGRGFRPHDMDTDLLDDLRHELRDATLVGSNPAFDAAFLTKTIGVAVWSHRLVDVAAGAMWVLGWDRPRGLADVAAELRARGHVIPEPDHTAAGDVEATVAVYLALNHERAKLA